jgi:hypothetical protein
VVDTPAQRLRDFSRAIDSRTSSFVFPLKSPKARWFSIALAVIVGLSLLAVTFLAGYSSHGTPTSTRSLSTASADSPSNDIWYSYRHKPSYIGSIGATNFTVGHTYYLPSSTNLIETGNYEWFIGDVHTPVLTRATDAGHYALKLTVAASGTDYMFQGGGALVITLPDHYKYEAVECESGNPKCTDWLKGLNGPSYDLRDTSWDFQSVVPVAEVLPAPGLKLSGYFGSEPSITTLSFGKSEYVDMLSVKYLIGTKTAYVENDGYYTNRDVNGQPSMYGGYVRVTRTSSGFVVCSTPTSYTPVSVPRSYRPLTTEIQTTVSSDDQYC